MEVEEALRCELCMKLQSSKPALKQHIRRIHSKAALAPIQCNLCQKILRDEHTLKCHIKAVHDPKKFPCPQCTKSFSQVGILNAHLKVHSDEKLFTCEICEQKYKDVSYFKRHQESHFGNKPHECNVCGKKYLQASHLKDHLSAHTGERKFTCDICMKSFRHSKPYKEHINMHQGIKPHKCSVCSYTSAFKKNLNVHVKRHNLDSLYYPEGKNVHFKCEECEESFTSSHHLKTHKHSYHPLVTEEILIDHDEMIIGHSTKQCPGLLEDNDPPIIILVNLPQELSGPGLGEDLEEVGVRVEEVVEEEGTHPMSPMALLLSAAESSEDCDDGATAPLDLSITASGSAQLSKNPDNDFLEFTSVNSGRRRSVFLAEELDFEHQADMTIVDPLKVIGGNN